MKKEITRKLSLSEVQRILMNMHGFINPVTILDLELKHLKKLTGNKKAFKECFQIINNIRKSISEDSPTIITPHQIQEFNAFVEQEIAAETRSLNPDRQDAAQIDESVNNIRSIFKIIHIRVRELIARSGRIDEWMKYNIDELKENLAVFLKSLENNSRGRYRIVYDKNEKRKSDYLVHLTIETLDKKTITLPSLYQDCMMDLLANARKYTSPGGTLNLFLKEQEKSITLQVSDNGRGIPEDQIERVVLFGFRADNVVDKHTHGGGFGLTKAYYVTRELGGRMWIESELDDGTTIIIHIPKKH